MLGYRDIIEAIKNDHLYDFINNNYWQIAKTELRDIILEIYYILRFEGDNRDINEKLVDYLKNNRDWDE